MNIGIYGGAFNPITKSHIKVAELAMNQCKLDVIYFEVSHSHYKNTKTNWSQRARMVQLAILDANRNKEFRLGSYDNFNEHNRQLYAYETLKCYKKSFDIKDNLYYIIGSDEFRSFDKWKNSDEILLNHKLIVIERHGVDPLKNIPTIALKYFYKISFILNNDLKGSSSDVRSLLKSNSDVSGLIPNNVYNYIQNKKELYMEEQW